MIKLAEASCRFQVSQLVTGKAELAAKSSSSRRMMMTGACLCQWCYVYLGDLARYREQLAPKPDWSKPREYYFNAQLLAPKDGRPYNQLAVVAISAQRRLDAVYFYMRSLAAKNQWLSAHDSLVGIFEDTCRKAKKVEEEEKARRCNTNKEQKKGPREPSTRHVPRKGAIRRKETWVMPGTEESLKMRSSRHSAGRRPPGMEQSGCAGEGVAIAEQCEQVVTSELNRKLTSAFLVVHGKLFTKIGIESFSISLRRFVSLWRCALLRTQETVLDSSQTLKMVIINIFNIHHVKQNSDNEAGKKLYCGMAFSLSLELCTAIFQSYLKQLESNGENMAATPLVPPALGPQPPRETSSKDSPRSDQDSSSSLSASPSLCDLDSTAFLLPAVKLWFDWLERQQDFWTSFLPGVDRKTLSTFWDAVFLFLNKCFALHKSELCSVSLVPKPPLLWEDKITAGFIPLKGSISTEETFAIADAMQLSPEQHHAQCLLRLSVIMKFVCIPVVEEEGSNRIEGAIDRESEEGLTAELQDVQLLEAPDENLADDEVKELPHVAEEQIIEESTSDGEDVAIDQLKKERDKLSKEVESHHHAIENVQTLISEAINKASEEVYIEPKYLVPDTNCFISSLPAIQALVKSQLFVVAVPLIVMAELDGLSKGSDLESSTTSAKISSAKQAIEYARTEILNKSSHIKLLTTQGSLLSSLQLKEEVGEEASNDNLILRSSMYLHTKMDKGTKGVDFYSVVLLTDDRNLRVKALANSLPVKDMSAFMLMANLAQAQLGGQLEEGHGSGSDISHSRPADILVPNWLSGKPAAFDLTVVSPLNSKTLNEAGATGGSAAGNVEARKHTANDQKCRELGWVCVPLAVETYGCWGEEAQCSVSRLAARLALQLQCSKSKAITNIYQRLNLTLVRCNARALLSRSRLQHAEGMG
ncbi:hypothetical protein EMCRGX_G032719 [Ephydatia muelleri]